jgi:hypothetical protein
MSEKIDEQCGKCGAEIDPRRRVDYTLKDGTRVCEACFIKKADNRPSVDHQQSAKRHDWTEFSYHGE